MYALIVDFIKTPTEVDPYVEPHRQWVKKYFDEQLFILAGPNKNQLGGVILAKSMDKKKLLAILAEDPYVMEDVAEYRVVDFHCKATLNEISLLQNA